MIQEYRQRREKLMSNIGVGNIGIMTAAPELIRNGDAHYRYRQNSDFYYLTGFREPEAVLVMIPGRTDGEAGRGQHHGERAQWGHDVWF